LRRRGYQAIHGDWELVYRGDPATVRATDGSGNGYTDGYLDVRSPDLGCRESTSIRRQPGGGGHLSCGGSRNFAKFVDLFDGVFVLDVDLDTMSRRIDERVALDPTDFGGKPEERELTVRLHQTKEDVPKNGIIIDATRPLEHMVDEILTRTRTVD
jgi:hypothetical protein